MTKQIYFTFEEQKNTQQQIHTVTVPRLRAITKVQSNTYAGATVSVIGINGDEVTLRFNSIEPWRREQSGGIYIPEDTKSQTINRRYYIYTDWKVVNGSWVRTSYEQAEVPDTLNYNLGGYSGTLYNQGDIGYSPNINEALFGPDTAATPEGRTLEIVAWGEYEFTGNVTKPQVDTRTWDYYYVYYVWVTYYEKGVSFRIGINGAAKKSIRGWVRVNDEAIEVREVDSKINGVLRGQSFDI